MLEFLKWKKINSAPRDGTKIDLWVNIYASPRSMGMADSFRLIDAYYKDVDGKPKGWHHMTDEGEELIYEDYIVRWMRAPKPPKV